MIVIKLCVYPIAVCLALFLSLSLSLSSAVYAQDVNITGLSHVSNSLPTDAFIFQRQGATRDNFIFWAELLGNITIPPSALTGAVANQVFVSDGSGNPGWNTATGDVLYSYFSGARFSVVGIQGSPVSVVTPTDLSTLIYDVGAAQYAPGFPSSGVILPTAVYTGSDYPLNCTRDDILLMNVLTLSRTVTLPDATTARCTGKTFTIVKADASGHTVAIATTASQTINSLASSAFSLVHPNQTIRVVSDGLNWFIAGFGPGAFPNCIDSGGQHTNYTASTNTFSCGTSLPSIAFSSLTGLIATAQLPPAVPVRDAASGNLILPAIGSTLSVSCTGVGSSAPSPTIIGTNNHFTVTIKTGTLPSSSGTCTVTFSTAYGSASPIACMLVDGASAWGNEAVIRQSTESASAPVFTWVNDASAILQGLTASSNYKFSCVTIGIS